MAERRLGRTWRGTLWLFLGVACGSSSGGGSPGGDGGTDGGLRADALPTGDAQGAHDGASKPDGAPPKDGGGGDTGPAPIAGLRLFYSDLESGPNAGGENGKGAFVTLYGNGFGASRGTSTVTVGGGAADNYPIWTNTKITLQLGPAAKSGDMVVHVASKGASNALSFTVRSGNIYFVTSKGSDGAAGSFSAPWATIPQAKNKIAAGDIAYIGTSAGDSVSQTTLDASSSYDCALGMSYMDGSNSGTADAPKALVVYPGATATIGDPTSLERGILVPAISGNFDYWVVAGFTLRGLNEAINLEGEATGWRVIANDMSCPNGSGLDGCATGGDGTTPTDLKFYGNVMHDAAANVSTTTKYYHSIYFGSNQLELAWNVVYGGKACRGIQFHDSGGPNEYGLSVHDNLIHDIVCDAINFATVDPSKGKVEAYNNVIYNAGVGPDPDDGAANYTGIYVSGETDSGSDGTGSVEIYNNTLYNCGSRGNSDSGAFNNGGGSPALKMNLVDNLVYATGSDVYLAPDSAAGLVTGSNNVWFGASGGAPSGLSASVTSDPMLVNPTGFNFHLMAGSPAIGKGTATSALFDFDGNPRGASFDIGAYEHTM
jgi:IPT/TIG domain